jgi:serine/threonine protein phosphatase PrpC
VARYQQVHEALQKKARLGRETRSDQACQRLVECALAHGGKDNVTIVLARYSVPVDEQEAIGCVVRRQMKTVCWR